MDAIFSVVLPDLVVFQFRFCLCQWLAMHARETLKY